ncbi:MAG TPA: type 4a pilus biogenesis protein PilO [Candidatus Bathyarchaeia archaeon]|nr:type 4a pilus biogenesis protein PilO [Candidatus Bathyarchaeia archaeon]
MFRPGNSLYSNYLNKVADFYQKKQVKIYTSLILSLVTTSFFALFAIKPTTVTIASLSKEIKDQKEITNKLDGKIKDLSLAQKEYSSLKPKLSLIDEALPPASEPAVFFGQLEVIAKENNLEFSSAQSRDAVLQEKGQNVKEKVLREKNPYPTFKATLSLNGNYEDMQKFLESLLKLRRIINVNNLSIQKGKRASSAKILSTKLELETFYLPLSENEKEKD